MFRIYSSLLEFFLLFKHVTMDTEPTFRILAPEFICPKEGVSSSQLEDVVITMEIEPNSTFQLQWTVRWLPLADTSQRFTLMLWKSVRTIEAKFNNMPPDSGFYVINNEELLSGVKYIFNVTAIDTNEGMEINKYFCIETIKKDALNVEGSNTFSIKLFGSEITYADIEYVVETQVNTCQRSLDYSFIWSVVNADIGIEVNVNDTIGTRLTIDAYSLIAGLSYNVTCFVINNTNAEIISEDALSFEVLYRGLQVYLSADVITIPIDNAFQLESIVVNHDYINENPHYEWHCSFEGDQCEVFYSYDNESLIFLYGLPNVGRYNITVIASIRDQVSVSSCIIITVSYAPAIFEIKPIPRKVNEDSLVYLTAIVFNVTSSSTFAWYFLNEDDIIESALNTSCRECLYGSIISDLVTINITEENFLMELQDANWTDRWQVNAELTARAGNAKFVVKYNSPNPVEFNEDVLSSNVTFTLNESPQMGEVMIWPKNGTALETVFYISVRAAVDKNKPLRYSFYCNLGGNESLLLASYLEHLSVITCLPYVDGGVTVWAEACDSLAACSTSETKSVIIQPSSKRTLNNVLKNIKLYIVRCEIMYLKKMVLSAMITYKNLEDTEAFSRFTKGLLELLPTFNEHCIHKNYEDYIFLLNSMTRFGIDVNGFL